MKKKTIFLLMVLLIVALTGCGKNNTATEDSTTKEPEVEKVAVADSADLLNKVWDTFEEDQKFFAMGGDFNNPVDNAAGIFNIEDTENLTYMLYIPADRIALIDEAASLIHAMNTNTFTGAAFHLTDAANAQVVVDALKENILNTQWMCGFPDKLVIFTVNDDYVVFAFGNEEIVENFKTKLIEVYGDATFLYVEEDIA